MPHEARCNSRSGKGERNMSLGKNFKCAIPVCTKWIECNKVPRIDPQSVHVSPLQMFKAVGQELAGGEEQATKAQIKAETPVR